MNIEFPAEIRHAAAAELAGEFTTAPGTPERDAEIEDRIAAGNRIYDDYQLDVRRTAYEEMRAAGMSEITATALSGYDPTRFEDLEPVPDTETGDDR